MRDESIEIGDIVRLNSSPLKMTVKAVKDGRIIARWIDQTDDLLEDEFDRRELILVRKAGAA